MSKRLSPAAVVALKEALCAVYWFKDDLRGFLHQCLSQPAILATLNWGSYKRQIASDLVDYLIRGEEKHLGDLTKLCYEVCSITTFTHLEQLEDGTQKAQRAKAAIAQLKALVEPHKQIQTERDEFKQRQGRAQEKLRAGAAIRQKLDDIRVRYAALVVSPNPQGRGFELERIMYDIFELFDLDPKASFRNTGEQIDGAFCLEGTDYLFEARWQKELVNGADLDVFAGKIRRKLENTLGAFLSTNGFSSEGVRQHSGTGAAMILLDGADLMAVLEERIDFVSLFLRKKRHAARTGSIYLTVNQILSLS